MNSTSSGPVWGAPIVTNTASSSPAARNDLAVSGATRTAVQGSRSTTSPSKLALRPARHEEVDLFLDRVPVAASVRVSLRRRHPPPKRSKVTAKLRRCEHSRGGSGSRSDPDPFRHPRPGPGRPRHKRWCTRPWISSLLAWSRAIGRDHLKGSRLPHPRRLVGLRTDKFRCRIWKRFWIRHTIVRPRVACLSFATSRGDRRRHVHVQGLANAGARALGAEMFVPRSRPSCSGGALGPRLNSEGVAVLRAARDPQRHHPRRCHLDHGRVRPLVRYDEDYRRRVGLHPRVASYFTAWVALGYYLRAVFGPNASRATRQSKGASAREPYRPGDRGW